MTMPELIVTVNGDKRLVQNLNTLAGGIEKAISRGLERIAKGIHSAAYEFLSGAGAKESNVPAGGYPVPVRTGHLRQMLDWLKPGESKSTGGMPVTAARNEAVIYDITEYAVPIHEGTGSSQKFGPRAYLTDGLRKFNTGDRIAGIVKEEIAEETARAGL
jgi:hypothetical protein